MPNWSRAVRLAVALVTAPLVSIVLPTLNGAATLPALLDAIARQRVSFTFEIVVVDSQSSDGTAEFVRASRALRWFRLIADAFDHGLARNLGIEQAKGDLIVLLVQDALPVSDDVARRADEAASAQTGSSPRPMRVSSLARMRARSPDIISSDGAPRPLRLAFSRFPIARRSTRCDPRERFELCIFDNVCSCIRRSVWNEHPFRATPIGEDVEWAKEVLLGGISHRLRAAAQVVHSHDRSARYELARTYALHRRLYELFGLEDDPDAADSRPCCPSSLVLHLRCAMRDRSGPARRRPRDRARLGVARSVSIWARSRQSEDGSALVREVVR